MGIEDAVAYGAVAVDVGANVGTHTEAMQKRGATVWAIEPDPRCHDDLRRLLATDQVLGVALGDHEGTTTLYRSKLAAHNSCWADNLIEPTADWPPLQVPVTTLDALQASGALPPQIDLVKVDAQGAEVAILRGAARLIATQHPAWYLECWPKGLRAAGASVREMRDLLEPAGYRVRSHAGWDKIESYCAQIGGHSSIDVLVAVPDGEGVAR